MAEDEMVGWHHRLDGHESELVSCSQSTGSQTYSMPGYPAHHQLLGLTLTYVPQVCDAIHLILFHPLLLLPSIFPSMKVFSNESVLCIRWPKDWSFSFSISPSNEYSGLISFRIH